MVGVGKRGHGGGGNMGSVDGGGIVVRGLNLDGGLFSGLISRSLFAARNGGSERVDAASLH